MSDVKSDLFKDVKYYVTGSIEPEIEKLLENGGASSTKIMFTNITHLLCGVDFDEKEIGEAADIYDIPSVTGEWVEASVRLGRLACPKTYHPIPSGLFTPVVAAINQLNVNDRKKLFALITFHGGRVERNFTAKTTHLICSIATGNVYTKASEMKSDKFSIVTPDWFHECLKAQELIDTKRYHPRLLKPGVQNSSTDNRSLSMIMGFEENNIKKTETKKPSEPKLMEKAKSAVNSALNHSTPPVVFEEKTPKNAELPQKQTESMQQRNQVFNQSKSMEQPVKELEQPVPQSPQVSKPPAISTPTTSVQTHLLQKQLEQPLKADNQTGMMQQSMQNQQPNPQPNQQINQQFQMNQQQKALQNQQQAVMQTQQMIGQVKLDHPNQMMIINSSQSNVLTNVQNINQQPQQNQIQIQPIQQQQQQQAPNQMQQIGIDQSGQIQFVNQTGQGTPNNFNAVQNQQIKVVQQQQHQQQQQPQQMQQPAQFIVQSPGPNKTILNQNVVFINQSGQQQIITTNQQQGNNVALIQQRNISSQQSMQIQGQQILIHSTVQQPSQNQLLQSPQQQTQYIVQTSTAQGNTIVNQTVNQRMQKGPGGAPQQQWFLQQQTQQQQVQQQPQQPGMPSNSDVPQSVSPQQMQTIQQKLLQQSPGQNQQVTFSNIQNVDQQDGVLTPQHNQTIMITGSQAQPQQPSQTPSIQQGQGMMQGQPQMQKVHVQNQQIVLTPNQSPQQGAVLQSVSPQQQKQQPGQVNAVVGQPQFIRATRPQWAANQQGPQRQLIHLDAQTHAHLQTLEPIQRAEYLGKLQTRKLLYRQQQQGFIQQGNAVGQQRPNHIIARPQGPGGTVQWMQQQQQQQRPLIVRSSAPGLTPIAQQTIASPGGNIGQQSPVAQQPFQDPNAPPQFQRIQIQQAPGQKPMPQGNMVVAIQKPFTDNEQQQQATNDGAANQMQMNKTKTALANMLSSRLGNSGNNGTNMQMQTTEAIVEPSAAGTLRMMTAQHNPPATQGQQQFQVDPNSTPQFQRIQIQAAGSKPMAQGNIIVTAQKPFLENMEQVSNQITGIIQQSPIGDMVPLQIQMNKSKPAMILSPSGMTSPPFSPNRPLPRPQFYGHNPNLKLPADLFLLGCIFYIVEYDETNESEVPEWKKLIQLHGGEVETLYCPRVTHVLCRTQRHGVVMQAIRDAKRCVTAYWLNDTILRMQVQPPSEALHLPMPNTFGTQRPAAKHIISVSGFDGDERLRIKQMVEQSGALLTPYLSRHNSVLICKSLEGNKCKRAKEWNIPVVNCVWLSDILQGNLSNMSQYDQQKYQQYNLNGALRIDYSLVAHLMNAWKSPINLTQDSYERVKRLIADPAANEPKPKKVRKYEPLEILPDEIVCNEKPEQVPRIAFSQVDNLEGLKNAVKSLGGEVVSEPETATHLVLTHLVRTYKLLFSLCSVEHIISSKWIVDSAKAGKFLRPDEYTLSEENFRKLYDCNIQEVIKSTTRKTLFAGKTFFVTPSVRPKHKDMVKLIEFCGGKVETKRRTAVQIAQANSQQPDSYIILTCPQDLHLMHDLLKASKPNRFICSTEFVLAAIMLQKIEFEPHTIIFDRPKP